MRYLIHRYKFVLIIYDKTTNETSASQNTGGTGTKNN